MWCNFLDNFGKDKFQHAIVSAAICAALKCVVGLPLAVFLTLAVGVGKELYDRRTGGTFDMGDITADIIGTIIGAI
jgi:uncharacterized protein YfiM (DUF2279 family)